MRKDPEVPKLNLPRRYMTRDLSSGTDSLAAGERSPDASTAKLLSEMLAKATPDPVDREQAIAKRMRELDQRMRQLEQSAMRYRDVYRRGNFYALNDAVTHGGALWVVRATNGTTDRPGTSGDWRLATKTRDR